MGEPAKVVAILAANPALASLLTMVLASDRRLRVRAFESQLALTTYMRVAPVDVVVADFDSASTPADVLARELRFDGALAQRQFHIIALTRTVDGHTRQSSVAMGIDEVIVKPMSPKYLLERVQARARRRPMQVETTSGYRGPERRGRLPSVPDNVIAFSRRTDKVTTLFPARPTPGH